MSAAKVPFPPFPPHRYPATPGAGSVSGRAASVSWKINREAVVVLSWGAAVLMQFAHPLVAAGVAEHSVFRARPELRLQRVRQTIAAMLALTFGTDQEIACAAQGINAIHDRVHGRLREAAGPFPAGTPYSAHDPALLAWVHATLLDVAPRAYELFVGPLTREERDRYCLEASQVEPLLGIPAGTLPRSQAALDQYLRAMEASGQLVITPAARELARLVLAPARPPLAVALRPLTAGVTIGLLPPAFRAAYGLAWPRGHERLLRGAGALTRHVLPLLPAAAHEWPAARRASQRLLALRP